MQQQQRPNNNKMRCLQYHQAIKSGFGYVDEQIRKLVKHFGFWDDA